LTSPSSCLFCATESLSTGRFFVSSSSSSSASFICSFLSAVSRMAYDSWLKVDGV
jgi:hypothetical protein